MDIFERLKSILSTSNIKPSVPQQSTARGIDTINQIRSSLNLPSATPQLEMPKFQPPTPISTARFEPSVPRIQPQIATPMPKIQAQPIMSVRPPEPKAIPFQTFTPRVPEAETALGKFIVAKGVQPLDTGIKKISSAWNNTDNKGGLERALTGVEGVGLIASIPNEAFIQPVWDSIKLGIKGVRTGKVTQDDINNYIFSFGGEKGTIFDAFGTNEEEFGKQYGNLALQTARFFDFAPELVNLPSTSGGKTVTLAREAKIAGLGAKEAPKISKIKKLTADEQDILNTVKEAIYAGEPDAGKQILKESGVTRFKFEDVLDLTKKETDFQIKKELFDTNVFNDPQVNQYLGTINKAVRVFNLNRRKGIDDLATISNKVQGFDSALEALQNGLGREITSMNDVAKLYTTFIRDSREIQAFPKTSLQDLLAKINEYEKVTGQVLDETTKNNIIKTAQNPNEFINQVAKKAPKTKEVPTKLTTNVDDVVKSLRKGVPTNTSEGANLGAKIISGVQKERRFAKTTVAGAERTAKQAKNILNDSTDLFNPINNPSEFAKAEKFVSSNSVADVLNVIRTSPDTRNVTYLGQALMNQFQKIGDYASEAQLALEISKRATEFGQAIQALSIWKKLSPTGAKIWAQKLANEANTSVNAVAGDKNFIEFTKKELAEIGKQAEKIGKATTEYDKAVQTQLLAKLIASKLPKEFLSKVGTLQTIAQLVNTKTLIRNIAGNMIFGIFEAVSNGVAIPLDMAVAMFSKKRGVASLNAKGYFKGFGEGFSKGIKEAYLGIDTMGNTSLEQGVKNGFVFQSKVMQGLEKTLNLVLKPFDRAFYEANYRATLEGLMKANKVTKPTQEMLEQAHYMGLYRTFQDDNVATKAFSTIKSGLNIGFNTKTKKFVVNPFGLGDLVLKYTKVPANMLVRAVDYSPLGYVKTVMTLAQPLFKKGPFNQAEFVNSIARATVGSVGVVNTGYILGKLGILTPKPDSNKDVRNAQSLDGVRSYAINVSALKRYVASGFDPESAKKMEGDELFSYDWAQPISIPLAMGANWAETEKLKKNSAQERVFASFGAGGVAFADAMNTLAEQPLLQGLKTTFSTQGLVQGIIDSVKGAPASFVPTILNQINQLTDNTRRETFDPNILEESKNLAINKIPFLAQSLPPRYDIFGKPAEKFQGGTNTFVNVMLNPAFASKIGSDENLKEVIRLYETTGETGVIPNTAEKKIKINKEDVILTGQEMSNYQKEIGTKSDEYIRKLLSNEDYYKLPDDTKASLIAKGLSNINSSTKINMFGDKPESVSFDVSLLNNNQMDNYVYKNVTDAILDQPKKEMSVKTDQLEVLLKGQRNPQEISKFIIENKIPQSSVAGVITKIKKDEVYNQLPAELQKYNGLSKSQLEELKKLKPQLSTEIIQYQNTSKVYDNVANAQIGFYKSFGTRKATRLRAKKIGGKISSARIRKPKKPSLKLAKLKPIKVAKPKQTKLVRITNIRRKKPTNLV